jgi:hypothetical protein
MSSRGVDFMHEWIDVNVTDGWRPASAETIDALVGKCASDAARRGIALAEIEEELEADIRTIIFEALVNDLEAEIQAKIKGRWH